MHFELETLNPDEKSSTMNFQSRTFKGIKFERARNLNVKLIPRLYFQNI